MEHFRIKVGDYDLIESGSIITMKDADIHFLIRDLEFVFRFVKSEEEGAKVDIVSNNGKRMEIELQNFENPLGIGNVGPMHMGKIDNLNLYILFRVSQLDDGGKTMHYSWLCKPIEIK